MQVFSVYAGSTIVFVLRQNRIFRRRLSRGVLKRFLVMFSPRFPQATYPFFGCHLASDRNAAKFVFFIGLGQTKPGASVAFSVSFEHLRTTVCTMSQSIGIL